MTLHNFLRVTICAFAGSGLLGACALSKGSGATTTKDDARITAAVKAAINRHPDLGPPNQIYVDTRERVVYLTGTVDDSLTGENATSVAKSIHGVTEVVDNISVDK
jgi:osmotically-inducible protein OsmY